MGRWWLWRRRLAGGWRGVALVATGVLLVLGLLGGIAVAKDALPPDQTMPAESTPGRADEVDLPPVKSVMPREKMDGALAAIAEAAATTSEDAALAVAQSSGFVVSGGAIRVLVESANPDLTPAKVAILATGGTVEAEYADTIQALMPPGGLDALAASPDVRYLRAPAGRAPGGMPGRGR